MKDYYAILEIEPTAGPAEVKKAYRQQALRHHPDRNRDNPAAAERFKEVVEAYGVLIDPVKRVHYDRCRARGGSSAPDEEFRYSREDIFRDLFNRSQGGSAFDELFKEFEKSGLRFDRHFFQKTLFGGRGLFIGGIFLLGFLNLPALAGGRLVGPLVGKALRSLLSMGAMKMLGGAVGQLLGGKKREARPEKAAGQRPLKPLDMVYDLPISRENAEKGSWARIVLPGRGEAAKIKVRIPAGSSSGQRLRLPGKGREKGGRRGDLYLLIQVLPEPQGPPS